MFFTLPVHLWLASLLSNSQQVHMASGSIVDSRDLDTLPAIGKHKKKQKYWCKRFTELDF